ncbi:hypothetical protein GB937_001869 [Aspergillus fischeri]|nr:hypothetical protein GB937_001869 [Aspergillus fischeri]
MTENALVRARKSLSRISNDAWSSIVKSATMIAYVVNGCGGDGTGGRETLLGCFVAEVCGKLTGGRDGGLGFAFFLGEEGVDAEAVAREADHDGVVAHSVVIFVSAR